MILIFRFWQLFWRDGHILLEDIPGVGKTTLALAVSRMMNFGRETGAVYPRCVAIGFDRFYGVQKRFTAICLSGQARCSATCFWQTKLTVLPPKTQSALLEVMEERQVTVDGETRPVPSPFIVIATQNPPGTTGTQRLPEAQMDRFLVSLTIGYPDVESEITMAKEVNEGKRSDRIRSLINGEMLRELQREVEGVFIHDRIYEYIVSLVTATRKQPELELGVSPRGTLAMVENGKSGSLVVFQGFCGSG